MTTALEYGPPVLFVIFIWWASTGLIFFLNGLSEATYRFSLLGAAAVAAAAVVAVGATRAGATPLDASIAFTGAIAVWGLIEMSFLMGFVTGPRRTACPEPCTPWERLCAACAVIAHHEIALLVAMAGLAALTLGSANEVAFWTFAVLWLMRLSTKLNIFLGVPNTAADLLPRRIAYIKSYFRNAPMNALFPLSITLATAATYWLTARASGAASASFELQGSTLLATLCALGLIEHWFLVLPLRVEKLWAMQTQGAAARTNRTPVLPGNHGFSAVPVIDFAARKTNHATIAARVAACSATRDA